MSNIELCDSDKLKARLKELQTLEEKVRGIEELSHAWKKTMKVIWEARKIIKRTKFKER